MENIIINRVLIRNQKKMKKIMAIVPIARKRTVQKPIIEITQKPGNMKNTVLEIA